MRYPHLLSDAVRTIPIVAIVVASVVFAGCGGEGSDDVSAPSADPLVSRGKELASASCMGCHTVDGDPSSGPTWKGLAGSQVTLLDGRTVVADDAYLTRSIQDPDADQVTGFTRTMAFAVPPGTVSDDDAQVLVAYIKSLSL